MDDWRPIPYADPGLPSVALPADWPGTASVALFGRLGHGLADAASHHVRVVVGHRGEHSEGMSDVTHDLPAAVRTLVEATNAGDTARFLTAFTEDAVLDDWGRRFRGRAELASWDRTDNIGKRSHFDVSGLRPGPHPTRCCSTSRSRGRVQRAGHVHRPPARRADREPRHLLTWGRAHAQPLGMVGSPT